jgi:hypothetical protein
LPIPSRSALLSLITNSPFCNPEIAGAEIKIRVRRIDVKLAELVLAKA